MGVGDETKLCLTIVGNKIDLERQSRAVESEEARKYAESVGAAHIEVSAKTGKGVENVFLDLTKKMLDSVNPSLTKPSSLANASSNMSELIPRTTTDDRVDLSKKVGKGKASSCC